MTQRIDFFFNPKQCPQFLFADLPFLPARFRSTTSTDAAAGYRIFPPPDAHSPLAPRSPAPWSLSTETWSCSCGGVILLRVSRRWPSVSILPISLFFQGRMNLIWAREPRGSSLWYRALDVHRERKEEISQLPRANKVPTNVWIVTCKTLGVCCEVWCHYIKMKNTLEGELDLHRPSQIQSSQIKKENKSPTIHRKRTQPPSNNFSISISRWKFRFTQKQRNMLWMSKTNSQKIYFYVLLSLVHPKNTIL